MTIATSIILSSGIGTEISVHSEIYTSILFNPEISVNMAVGAQGRKGDDGEKGEKGDKGDTGLPGVSIIDRFEVNTPSLIWNIIHNRGTKKFMHSLWDSNGQLFYAPISVIDDNSFIVKMTSANSGNVDVLFGF